MTANVRPRRSALYLPASNGKALAKARSLPADIIILDLEDAVAPEMKDSARAAAIDAIRDGGFGKRELAIRVNGLDTPWGREDLVAAASVSPDAILVPKISSPHDVERYNSEIATAGPATALWAMVETAAIVGQLDAVGGCARTTRLSLLVMGTNDLAREMRARAGARREVFLPILSLAVAAARANGLAILDGVCNEFRDLDIFRSEVEQGLEFGFDGKTLIHPAQIDMCNEIFSPSKDELEWAMKIISAFALPENAGKGAINVEGRMAELLHLDQARRTLAMASIIGEQVAPVS